VLWESRFLAFLLLIILENVEDGGMRRLIIHSSVALMTFGIGISAAAIFRLPTANSPRQRTKELDRIFIETKPKKLPTPIQATKANESSDFSIVVEVSEPNPNPPSFTRRYFKLSRRQPTLIDLDLTEDIDNQEVALNFRDDSEYRVFQRYRTSMTISAEGPHLDLVEWRHFDSPWTSLKTLGPKRFRTLATDQMEESKFPSTTKAEIMKEVRRHVGREWPAGLELVKDCHGPNDAACLVSISSIYLHIEKKVRNQWVNVGLVEIRIPMGC
jgi:hypothetical protein